MWRRVLERFRGRSTDRSGNWSDVPASRDHQVDWDTPHDLGLQTVEFVYRTMGIDDEWSIREPRGFTWWGHELAQRVWTEPARMSAGLEVYRLHAETALLRDVGDDKNPSERLACSTRSRASTPTCGILRRDASLCTAMSTCTQTTSRGSRRFSAPR
jgi:hypothetical protein